MFQYLLGTVISPWTLAGGVVALLVYYAWTKTRLKHEGHNIPPFPAPAKPFLGHTLLMKGKILDNLQCMREKAGDIYSLNLAGNHMIVVYGFENIREILVKYAAQTQDRPLDLGSKILGEENHGLFGSSGANWKEQRAVTNTILREFGMGKNLMAEKVATEVQMFINKLASLEGQSVHLPSIARGAVCNIVCSVAFGHRFDYDDENYLRLMENAYAYLAKGPPIWVFSAATFLQKIPGDLFGIKEWEACIRDLNRSCKIEINKIKQNLSQDDEPKSFIAAYLQEMDRRKESATPTYLNEPNLVTIIKSLLIGGTDTTSTTIDWCVLFCLHHPEVQEKVFEEIKTHVGTSRAPDVSDIPNLCYLTAVIRETQRLAGIAAFFSREVNESFKLHGYLIPKDSQLLILFNSVLHDENVWENPQKFYPERFLDASGHLLKPKEFVPFGIGRRICIGAAMAKTELDLFLAAMFQRFRFEPEDPTAELPSLEKVVALTVDPKPYKVRFTNRDL
ncbi:hypothetical protein RRG08_064948 [Elysia crispata]|uniref:Cytochrome P450 n=1 Tax=Elysia crispata TaxID=231223 RepID=A0AAE0ZT76_9GAST|nr:hypothetical protein RRG08_064948 [Elysia crispata]